MHIILPDNYQLPHTVHSFIILTQPIQLIAHARTHTQWSHRRKWRKTVVRYNTESPEQSLNTELQLFTYKGHKQTSDTAKNQTLAVHLNPAHYQQWEYVCTSNVLLSWQVKY
jgi:hypothetical protein